MTDWISCNDRLPEEGVSVLVCGFKGHETGASMWVAAQVEIAGHSIWAADAPWPDAEWTTENAEVTHWQPLPAPPEAP